MNATPVRVLINRTTLELMQGDITRQATDAIVNAANSSLLGGGGVDGAIHRAAGPELLAETRTLGRCQTGDAKLTRGYRLKAQYIIHAVGPVYYPGDPSVPQLLASAYRRSLEVAVTANIRTLAFPAISTGAYGYPIDEAAAIAVRTVCEFIRGTEALELVRFVLFDDSALHTHIRTLATLIRQHPDLIRRL